MMKTPPGELLELRDAVAGSVCRRRAGRPVTDSEYEALTDRQQAECRWAPDQTLVDRLMSAEQAHTARYHPETAG